MKKYLLLLLLFLELPCFAQGAFMDVHLEGKYGFTRGSSFQKFVNSYNIVNPDNKTKLQNFGATAGYSFGFDFIFDLGKERALSGFYMGYYQHQLSASTSSLLNNGYATREIRFKQYTTGADFGFGKIKENLGVFGFFGVYVVNVNLMADIKYRDGYRSIGSDSPLNGIYHGFGLGTSLGVKAYLFKGPIGFTAGIRWCPTIGTGYLNDQVDDTPLPEAWGSSGGEPVSINFQSVTIELGIALKIFGTQ